MSDGRDRAPNWEQMERLIEAVGERTPGSLLDGTRNTYLAVMKQWFEQRGADNVTDTQLTKLVDEWFVAVRDVNFDGYVDFDALSVSQLSTGTRGGSLTGKTCAVSTNDTAGQDDYAGLPLFACVDVNFRVDPVTLEPIITAIEGITKGFERYNKDKFVGVLQASGYVYMMETASIIRLGYSSVWRPYANIAPLPEAVRVDGSVRPWVVHAKYLNHTVDGKLTSYSGVIPTAFNISHNTLHTLAAATGTGWSGMCYCDWNFIRLMFHLKYASLSADGILQGCLVNNYNAVAAVAEVGVKRVLVTDANGIEAGMGVFVGTANDRGANSYSISGSGGCLVTSVETVTIGADTYTAIYVDTPAVFDTTVGGTYVTTFHWPNGSCDKILGTDGSPVSATSGKYAAKIQGIEYSLGGVEVLADTMANYTQTDGNYYFEPWFVNRTANQATSLTGDYKASGVKVSQPGSSGYQYIKKMALSLGLLIPDVYGGSSSTYYKDAWYLLAATEGVREVFCFGDLHDGVAGCGLSYAACSGGLAGAGWSIVSRPSPNGNRGEWLA